MFHFSPYTFNVMEMFFLFAGMKWQNTAGGTPALEKGKV
jgi:hypothetical protein